MIPEFNESGNLPEGVHLASMEELIARFGYNPKRAWLIDGLKLLISALESANCNLVYIDGSFVTSMEVLLHQRKSLVTMICVGVYMVSMSRN
ncbi:TPA: DUF6932 family protein [Vibrio alginolyticus]